MVLHSFDRRRIDVIYATQETEAVFFDVEFPENRDGVPVFIGLMNYATDSGIGVAIDPLLGTLTDAVNHQGVIGYLDQDVRWPHRLRIGLEVGKYGSTYVTTIFVNGEKHAYPALLLPTPSHLIGMVGAPVNVDLKIQDAELCSWEGEAGLASAPQPAAV
ncbi:MAG: hypothetical protein AAF514_11190 [Verrucomicrobiota bacterium]